MRVDFTSANAGKVLQQPRQPVACRPRMYTVVYPRTSPGELPNRTRVESIGELAAACRDDRHHRSEVNIEAEHPQGLAGDPPERRAPERSPC